jgi:Tubulin-tyrosine ligase family
MYSRMKEKVVNYHVDVQIVDKNLTDQLFKSFNGGKSCRNPHESMLIVQELITNPVLYKGHKMDFRLYFFLNSAHSLITTFYNGFGRVCPIKYSMDSYKTEVHISNLRSSFQHTNKSGIQAIESEPVDTFLIKSFPEVQKYLNTRYGIDFTDLTFELKDSILTILKQSKIAKSRPDSQFQLFAADYLITTEGQVKLLEINAFPDFVNNSAKKTKIYRKVFADLAGRIHRKLWKTKKALVKMIEREQFNESKAILIVAENEDL